MNKVLTDEEFNKYFSYLEEISDDYYQWSMTTARKEHIDEFGLTIKKKEIYYTRQLRKSVSSIIKLSKKSMENILFIVIKDNFLFQSIGKKLLESKEISLREAVSHRTTVEFKKDGSL